MTVEVNLDLLRIQVNRGSPDAIDLVFALLEEQRLRVTRAEMTEKAWTEIGAKAQADRDALLTAATDLVNDLTALRMPDPSALWIFGGKPLERDYLALKAVLEQAAKKASE